MEDDPTIVSALRDFRARNFDVTVLSPSSLEFEFDAKRIDRTGYEVLKTDGTLLMCDNPSQLPSPNDIDEIQVLTTTAINIDEIQTVRTDTTHVDEIVEIEITADDEDEIQTVTIVEQRNTQKIKIMHPNGPGTSLTQQVAKHTITHRIVVQHRALLHKRVEFDARAFVD